MTGAASPVHPQLDAQLASRAPLVNHEAHRPRAAAAQVDDLADAGQRHVARQQQGRAPALSFERDAGSSGWGAL